MSSLRVVGALLVLFVCLISSMAMGFDAEVGNGSASSVQCKERERQALLTLKQGLRDYCGVLTSWGNTGENHDECCKWEGVHCSHKTGHVIMLDLRGRPDYASCLEGTINSSLIELRYLSYLDFSFNFFHGGVPKFIDSFTHLKYLNLSYSFYGNNGIPFELGNLLHLQYLDLQANRLGGEFPTHFLNLSRLVHLNLAGNQLTGEIPDIFANISSLVYLDLSWNFFTGTIPHSLGNLLQLNYLDLSSSSSTANLDWLSDLTPNLDRLSDLTSNLDWLSNLTSMKTLKLASVNLGTVINWQQKLSNLSHLQELDLSGCNLVSSKFPLLFNHSANLAILQLSDNDLTGSIPKSLLNICNLSVLDLSYNSMSGRFDDFVSTSTNCANKSLQHLLLRENQMIGSVPDLSQFSFLQELDLQGNNLSGPIPKSMFDICRLSVLNLRDNNLNGRLDDFIPTSTDCAYKSLQQLLLGQNQITASAPNLSQFSSLQILDLYDNNLSGPIPKSLLNICSLRELDLSSNILSGRLDDFVSTTPGCAKKSLQHLSLIGNQITGTVPHLSQFSSLQDLFLANNRLNGTVSESIGQLSNLEKINLSNNSLQGVISEAHFSKLSKLEYLDLSFNPLVFNINNDWIPPFKLLIIRLTSCKLGSFPTWIRTQNNVEYLYISSAGISDTTPNWFWDLSPSLTFLDLSNNQIYGEIPNLPIEYTTFAEINLSFNMFHGRIPSFLSMTSSLDLSNNKFSEANALICANTTQNIAYMDLSNNQLSGEIPECWAHFESLSYLDLANNNFSGKLPTSMGLLTKMEAFRVRNNDFAGEIPFSLKNCKKLSLFDGEKNKFSGQIPTWIGDELPKLVILSLRFNLFSGSLPSNICQLAKVQLLDLSFNSISGNIPRCLNNLSALANQTTSSPTISQYVFKEYNNGSNSRDTNYYSASLMWKGKKSMFKNTLGLLKSIDLSSNNLNGEIPNELMDLVGLISLNISRNMLSGEIPTTIGQLKSLDVLDLSRNRLCGMIPSQISQLGLLGVLDLSYNNLSGEIPIAAKLQSFDVSTYMGNPELCGIPLQKCLSNQTDDTQNDGNHKENEPFLTQGFYISMGVGFGVGFWGVCSSIFLKRSCRYAYFNFLNNVYNKLYVMVAINMAKLQRWIGVST